MTTRYRRHQRDDEEPIIGRFRLSDGEFVVCRSRPGTVRVYAPDELRLTDGHRRLICTVTGLDGPTPESAFLASFTEPQWGAWRDTITLRAMEIVTRLPLESPTPFTVMSEPPSLMTDEPLIN